MEGFLEAWSLAARTSIGFFWTALWAFILGYALSAVIQVFVSRRLLHRNLGDDSFKSLSLASFFGFISSSCSFAALAATKSLFRKGASLAASLAYLLASTNLVIELGIVISLFLGWQFVVGEYVGGLLLILFSSLLIRWVKPKKLIAQAREHLANSQEDPQTKNESPPSLRSTKAWSRVGHQYAMEWNMVWKDLSIGFTIAGLIAAFVPDRFFEGLFLGSQSASGDYNFLQLLQHVVVAPLAAFLTFIGSMGNIPLAALLFDKGVSYAGLMAFIFSDLVVLPVLRINAKYYGWKMALFIAGLLFASLILSALILHYALDFLALLPSAEAVNILERKHFALDYGFYLNLAFLGLSALLIYLGFFRNKGVHQHHEMAPKSPGLEKFLRYLSYACYLWLALGMLLPELIN